MPPKTKSLIDAEKSIAETLTRQRLANGWTYEEFAKRMHAIGYEIHPSAIQKTEKSDRRITVNELVAYAKVFGVPVGYLIDQANWENDLISRDSGTYALEMLRSVLGELNRRDAALSSEADSYKEFSRSLAIQINKIAQARFEEGKADHYVGDIPVTDVTHSQEKEDRP